MYAKMNTLHAKRLIHIRGSTVEPVLGTLLNYSSMKKTNTLGIRQANKHVLMAALTYNLKKYLHFISRKITIKVQTMSKNSFFCPKLPSFFLYKLFLRCNKSISWYC